MGEAQLEFELAGVMSNKKTCRYVSTKHKIKEDVGLLLHGSDSLIMDNTVKVEVFNFLFAFVCMGKFRSQVSMPRRSSKVNSKTLLE